jgi:hypothetical protein
MLTPRTPNSVFVTAKGFADVDRAWAGMLYSDWSGDLLEHRRRSLGRSSTLYHKGCHYMHARFPDRRSGSARFLQAYETWPHLRFPAIMQRECLTRAEHGALPDEDRFRSVCDGASGRKRPKFIQKRSRLLLARARAVQSADSPLAGSTVDRPSAVRLLSRWTESRRQPDGAQCH